MAFKRWLGRAQAVVQVDTVTIAGAGSWATNDTITLTINAKDLVVTIGETSPTNTTVALAIKEAWENGTFSDVLNTKTPAAGGQDIVEHKEITATVSGAVVTLTHNTPGTPFTLTTAVTGGELANQDTATDATGPNHWDNVNNWEPGVDLPGADSGDEVVIENTSVPILYGLDQNAITNEPTITISRNFAGTIGLPKQNPAGYVEYRDTYLKIPITALTIGRGDGQGSGRIKIDTHDATTAVVIVSAGSPAEFGVESILLKSAAAITITHIDGSLAIAAFEDETAVVGSLITAKGSVRCGEGITAGIATVKNESGTLELFCDVTTLLTNAGGSVLIAGAAVMTDFVFLAGDCTYRSSGNITAMTIGGGGGASFDASEENSARTIATLTLKPDFSINDPLRSLTYSTIVFDATLREWSGA